MYCLAYHTMIQIAKISFRFTKIVWKFFQIRNFKIIPHNIKKLPKYADHPPNVEHGFAALFKGQGLKRVIFHKFNSILKISHCFCFHVILYYYMPCF